MGDLMVSLVQVEKVRAKAEVSPATAALSDLTP